MGVGLGTKAGIKDTRRRVAKRSWWGWGVRIIIYPDSRKDM